MNFSIAAPPSCFVVMRGEPAAKEERRTLKIPVLNEAPLRAFDRTRIESAPRGYHATHHRISPYRKTSGIPFKVTLRWMRSVPGSFWDFPAPRFWILNGQDARSPSAPRFWPPRITRSASARWWAQGAAHPCQRSLCFILL